MKTLWKVASRVAMALALVLLCGFGYVQATWDRDFSATPLPAIHASTDSTVIAQGRYLVRAVGHCVECHALASDPQAGIDGPLSGGYVIDVPLFGRFVAANLTSDRETGLGDASDGQIARAIQNGVTRHGKLAPIMMLSIGRMSPEDLTAIVSYLRTQAPVRKPVPGDEWGLLAKALSSKFAPRKDSLMTYVAAGNVSVERGRYLANGPAACSVCHTPFDPITFQSNGPAFSGSAQPDPDASDPGYEFVAPNLTPDSATGHMATWTEDQFVARLKQGRVYKASHMPWDAFVGMTDADVRSVYRYLRTLSPVTHAIGTTHRKVGDGPTQ